MKQVIFYTKEVCSLCEDALALLLIFQREYNFKIEERDIYTNDEWLEKYHLRIPVVEINGQQIDCEEMSFDALERLFNETIGKNKE